MAQQIVTPKDLAAILMGYLLGSIPFAHIITRWRMGLQIREVGIGNVGARNVWHVVGGGWGFLVLLLDGAKGLAAVLLARVLGTSTAGFLLTGPAAIAGHAFPLFLRFRGGKGLSTTFGLLLGVTPYPSLISLAVLAMAQILIRDLDRSVYFGAGAAILLPLAFGYPWMTSLYVLGLFLLLWLRKVQDRGHQKEVWATSGWEDVDKVSWYGASGSGQAEPPTGSDKEGAPEGSSGQTP